MSDESEVPSLPLRGKMEKETTTLVANESTDCPLTETQLYLLQTAAEIGRPDVTKLAERLSISPATVREHFKGIARRLGTTSKVESLLLAVRYRWVELSPPPPLHKPLQTTSPLRRTKTRNHEP
jgi:DNA-binding CsgD family transcriptional regulator